MSETTPYERIGGLDGLRVILADFYERVLADPIIGYMFWTSDIDRLVDKEAEFTACMLGAPSEVKYTGKGMRPAHSKHRIMGGMYLRRQKLLQDTLDDNGVDPDIRDMWLAHNDKLRKVVTGAADTECDHTAASAESKG